MQLIIRTPVKLGMHRALCFPSEEFPSLLFCSWQGDYMLKSNSYKLQSLVSSHLELLSGLTTIFLGGIHFFLKHVADRFRIFEKAPLPCSRFPFFKLVFATPKFSTQTITMRTISPWTSHEDRTLKRKQIHTR
jgi:hypothetical protein